MKSDADRRKAAKLRKKKGPLTAEQRVFLSAYEATKKKRATSKPTTKPAPAVRGPQLEWGRPTPAAVTVHETAAPESTIDPTANLWTPVVPEAPADAPAPLPGTPPQPNAGTPLVDAATPTAAPQGDPHAAEQFAGIVMFVAQIGIANALELAQGIAVPPPVAAMVTAENIGKYILFVGESAKRLAIKYNFRGIPLADEAIVGGTVALSVLAFRANTIRKANAPATKQVEASNTNAPAPTPVTPTVDVTAGGDLNKLWEKSS